MKFTLIVAAAMLALAQGSHVTLHVTQKDMESSLKHMTDKIVDAVAKITQTNQDNTWAQDTKTELQPVVAKAAEQLRNAVDQMEKHIQPLLAAVQKEIGAQLDYLQRQKEAIIQQLTDLTRATHH